MERSCAQCGKVFQAPKSEVLRGGAKYCSRECYQQNNHGGQGKPTWCKGLTKSDSRVASMALKISQSMAGHTTWESISEEAKERHRLKASVNIQERYASGWMPKAGRCKKIHYLSPIAGDVLLDGSWELLVAGWLDKHTVSWVRNKKRFPYEDAGRVRYYTPDFYLLEKDLYLEVKGYETDLDRLKWSQFPEKLVVLRKHEIHAIKRNAIIGELAELV